MAIIKNVVVPAKTRDDARIMAKKVGGKVIDNGKQSAVRWGVKADKQLTLKRSSDNLFKGVKSLGKVNVFTKKGYKMHLSLTGNLI
ncbi:TPA: hypothetical protein L2O37_004043 [Escherichia coli O25b:H4-ST131]|nr:hypothetical protein [Escherichia coli O25b:H4-ST131]